MAPLPFLVPLYARGKRIRPVVYHIAAKTFFVEFGGVKLIFGLFLWFLERIVGLVYKQYKFLTFSYSAKKDLVKLGISPCNIMVAQEGIELSNYIPSPFKESNPTLLMLGRLVKYKGVQYGILCLRILRESFPSVKMLIIGDGPYKQKLQSLAENVGVINNIKFLGKISESQKIEILGRAHLLLMCSLKEGWATPVIEANACGTIAVGFDVEGTRETIIHGKTGFLVPYGNVSELARVCNKLLEDRRIYGIMREECLKWSRKFELSRTIQQASSFILGN
jgi:glycosyltransferase involved in cell wall biosynthesis